MFWKTADCKKKELKEIIEENLETANSTCTCFNEKTKLR